MNNNKSLILFFIVFYTVWTTKELLFHPTITNGWPYVLSFFIKIIVWVGSVGIYLLYIDRIGYKKSFNYLRITGNTTIRGIIIGSAIGAFYAILVGIFFTRFSWDLGIRWVTTPLFAFAEEVVFRGFLMNKLQEYKSIKQVNMIQALVFTGIHLPIGILQRHNITSYLVIFIVGYGLGLIYKKTNSIWESTIVHSIYNLTIYIRQ
jgi:membrane protease YdiL (CAAX protease family)